MRSIQSLSARSCVARISSRSIRPHNTFRQAVVFTSSRASQAPRSHSTPYRPFSSFAPRRIAIASEKEEVPESQVETKHAAAQIEDAEYHEIADKYLDFLQLALEEASEADAQKAIEVEFSAGVMTISHTEKGEYVLNKQPPNKQIWLSSPVSGPKRFDWVVSSQSSMDSMNAKQDTEGSTGTLGDDGSLGGGRWIYLRDGTALTELLNEELDVTIAMSKEADATLGRDGPGASGVVGSVEG